MTVLADLTALVRVGLVDVLGVDEATTAAAKRMTTRRAARLLDDLTGADDLLRAQAGQVVRELEHDHGEATAEGRALWWSSALGQLVAFAIPDHPLSHAEAAELLGVSRGRITSLFRSGGLDRTPDGHVRLGSVVGRLVAKYGPMATTGAAAS